MYEVRSAKCEVRRIKEEFRVPPARTAPPSAAAPQAQGNFQLSFELPENWVFV